MTVSMLAGESSREPPHASTPGERRVGHTRAQRIADSFTMWRSRRRVNELGKRTAVFEERQGAYN
jgi:hypothetical protein